MKEIFIDENVNILTGDDARRRLAECSDLPFLNPNTGVSTVPPERWALAQRAEHTHWMKLGVATQDDRNQQHFRGFRSFAALHGRSFEHAIELGCGPFTNLRLIGRICRIARCTLLDPLIKSYLAHPYCYYDERLLDIGPITLPARTARKVFPKTFRRLQRALGRCVPIASLKAMPIEAFEPECPFDLIVMVNVLEHCFNAGRIFERILAACRPGTVFVFQDRLYDTTPLAEELTRHFDAAHPLKIDRSLVLDFLRMHFDGMFVDTVPRQVKCLPTGEHYSWEDMFFIGSRNSLDSALQAPPSTGMSVTGPIHS